MTKYAEHARYLVRPCRIDRASVGETSASYHGLPESHPMAGWMLRVIGKGQKEREVPLPTVVVGELAKYLKSRRLAADPENIGNQGAFLLG